MKKLSVILAASILGFSSQVLASASMVTMLVEGVKPGVVKSIRVKNISEDKQRYIVVPMTTDQKETKDLIVYPPAAEVPPNSVYEFEVSAKRPIDEMKVLVRMVSPVKRSYMVTVRK